MPVYLLGTDGNTSDEQLVIWWGSGDVGGWSRRGLGPGDETPDRFSLFVEGVICCGVPDEDVLTEFEAAVGTGGRGCGLLEDFIVATASSDD